MYFVISNNKLNKKHVLMISIQPSYFPLIRQSLSRFLSTTYPENIFVKRETSPTEHIVDLIFGAPFSRPEIFRQPDQNDKKYIGDLARDTALRDAATISSLRRIVN